MYLRYIAYIYKKNRGEYCEEKESVW